MNVLFILELLIIIFIFFIIYSRSFFFLLLNSVIFLFLLVSFSWTHDGDIFSSFLLIIDLGLFLVFFIIALSILMLFQPMINSFYRRFFLLPLLVYIYVQLDYSTLWTNVSFHVSFYDWYNLFNLFFISELHLIFECYFSFCSFEFFLINVHLYSAVLAVYYLIFLLPLRAASSSLRHARLLSFYKKHSLFLKWQNPVIQQNSPQVLRSWTR